MNLNFDKYPDGLVPAVVQDASSGAVLMHAYVSREAFEKTLATGYATFYSRSRRRLWTKGETSGNTLRVVRLSTDCDNDALLIIAAPAGPVCHLGTASCFGDEANPFYASLAELERTVSDRFANPKPESYVSGLYTQGMSRIAQKLGEEAVETVIAAIEDDTEKFIGEAADLIFHLIVLLRAKGLALAEIILELEKRRR
ncbi:MAG: bifunctional phosphoribosyl-AMP cyclohydrolase/phosphoribosyl-ATP diphosphatase [Blastocatellia bacterium]